MAPFPLASPVIMTSFS